MARVIFSPLISAVSGKTGDAVFARWKGRPYIRQRVIPSNPRTAAQTAVRNAMAECVAIWQQLDDGIVTGFNAGADELGISGYNDFVGRNRAALQAETGLFGPRRNLDAAGPRIQIPTNFAYDSEPAPGQSKYDWTDPGQGGVYRFGILCYNATDNVVLIQSIDWGGMADESFIIASAGVGDVFLVNAFVYRNTDDELLHFGSTAHTQAS